MNPFESGVRKVIPAVLVYVKSADDRLLMIHRGNGPAARADDHAGKWNGLGGKLELDESPLQGAIRELREESGLELGAGDFRMLGVLQFPNFKAQKSEDWLVFVLTARLDAPAAQIPFRSVCDEGQLHWVPASDVGSLDLWPGDRFFMPYVIEDRPFAGTIWYEGKEVARQWVVAMEAATPGAC